MSICECKDIRNSYQITGEGLLVSVLECEDCGKRTVEHMYDKYKVPEHLKHVSADKIKNLKYLFRG
mgnify:CR=1 FL=1